MRQQVAWFWSENPLRHRRVQLLEGVRILLVLIDGWQTARRSSPGWSNRGYLDSGCGSISHLSNLNIAFTSLQLHVDHILFHSGVVDQLHDVMFVALIGVPGHLDQVGCPCLRVLATAPFRRCSRLQGRSTSPPAAASRHGGRENMYDILCCCPSLLKEIS